MRKLIIDVLLFLTIGAIFAYVLYCYEITLEWYWTTLAGVIIKISTVIFVKRFIK